MKTTMRDFDDIAELWRKQSPAAAPADGAERARQVESEIRGAVTRRRNDTTWGVGLLVLALLGSQVLGTANLISSATGPAPLTLLHFVLFQLIYAALLLYFAHRLVVGREIHQTECADLRNSLDQALDETETAMRDFRVAAWVDPWLFVLIPLISTANARLSGAITTASLLAKTIPLVLSHVIAWIFAWRYYHTVLRERRAHLRSLLGEITSEPI